MKKLLRRILTVLAMALVVPLLSACGSGPRLMFGTGGTAGTYYAYGGVIAQYLNNYADVNVTAVSTGGSKVNIQSIQDGDFQIGFAQPDVMTYAWEGTRAFEKDGATHSFRVLGSLYAETVQVITMDDNIKSIEDLRGKSVSIGASGSGVYFNALDVLDAAGIGISEIKPQYQSFEASKESLKDGLIDAAFVVAGAPTSAITELATTNGVKVLNIDGELRKRLFEKYPYYKANTIPAGTYTGQNQPIESIAVPATLIVSTYLEDDVVYRMTAAIFDHKDQIAIENAKGKELNLQTATSITNIPYHPGAAKYYAEQGIKVNTKE